MKIILSIWPEGRNHEPRARASLPKYGHRPLVVRGGQSSGSAVVVCGNSSGQDVSQSVRAQSPETDPRLCNVHIDRCRIRASGPSDAFAARAGQRGAGGDPRRSRPARA